MNTQLLEHRALAFELWSDATTEHYQEGWTTEEQADMLGDALAGEVIAGKMSRAELRNLNNITNSWDRDAVWLGNGDIKNLAHDADYQEAIARRIANQATAVAILLVKSKAREERLRYFSRRLCAASGMGFLEVHDYARMREED